MEVYQLEESEEEVAFGRCRTSKKARRAAPEVRAAKSSESRKGE